MIVVGNYGKKGDKFMTSRARKIIDEKVESLKLLTGNQDLIVKYNDGKYGLIAGLSEAKKMYSSK